jgi:VanZ family protein
VTHAWVRWALAAGWAAFLFLLSSRPILPVELDLGLDKVAHFLAYVVLGFLLTGAVRSSRMAPWLAVVIGWAYGAADELHQSTVPGRIADLSDWFADAAGILAGTLLFLLINRMRAGPADRASPIRQT